MAMVQWIKIIIAILELIAEGADKQTAVSKGCTAIWRK